MFCRIPDIKHSVLSEAVYIIHFVRIQVCASVGPSVCRLYVANLQNISLQLTNRGLNRKCYKKGNVYLCFERIFSFNSFCLKSHLVKLKTFVIFWLLLASISVMEVCEENSMQQKMCVFFYTSYALIARSSFHINFFPLYLRNGGLYRNEKIGNVCLCF